MARRISTGTTGESPIIGTLAISGNTISTTEVDSNLTLSANGNGVIVVSNLSTFAESIAIEDRGSLQLREAIANGQQHVALRAPVSLSSSYSLDFPTSLPAADGQALVATTGGVASWTSVQPGLTYSTVSTSFNAAVFNGYFVNTTGGAVTATLPAAPAVGDFIRFFDVAKTFDTNNLTVGRNSKLIQGDAADMTVNVEGAAFELVFSGDTYGWRIFSI